MRYRLGTLSLAASTLLLLLPSSVLLLSHVAPLSAQAFSDRGRKTESDRIFQTGIEQVHKGQLRQALETYQRALVISQQAGNRTGVAEALHHIASVYETQGQYENALKFYEQALPIRREVKDKAGEAATLIGIGNTYLSYIEFKKYYDLIKKPEEVKPYQEIIKYYEQALVITREIGDRTGEAWSLNGIGMTYSALGKKEDALKFHEQALAIVREVGNHAGEATILFHTGQADWSEVDSQRETRPISLDFYEQALAIARKIGHRPLQAQILSMMGLRYFNRWYSEDDEKRFEAVLEIYKQALALVRPEGNRLLEERVLEDIGATYFRLGYPQTAQEYQEQALAIRQEMGLPGNWATDIVKQAILVIYSTPKKRPTLITFLEGEGLIHYRNAEAHTSFRRYQAALESYQEALTIVRRQRNRPWEWLILNQMGKVYETIGQSQLALETYKQSLTIRREVDERAAREPIPYTIRVAYGTNVNIHGSEGIRLEDGITNGLIRVGEGDPVTIPITTIEDTKTIQKRGRRRLEVVAGIAGEAGNVRDHEEENTLTNLGNIYKAQRQYQAALNSYQEALTIIRQEAESEESEEARWRREISGPTYLRRQEQRIFRSMGSVYEALGRYQAAIEYYQQSLAIAKEENYFGTSLWNQIPILLTQIGKAYEQLGQYQAALEAYQQALAITSERRGYYRGQEELIRKYGQEEYFRRYRKVYEKPDEEALLNSIATIYEKLGQNQAAQEYRQQALAFRQEFGNRTQEDVTSGKAILRTFMGTDERKRTITQINRLEGEGVILFVAGNTYSVQKQYQAALQSYKQALAIVRQQRNRPWEGVILHQIGSVYQKLGQNQAALDSYQQALIIRQEIDRRPKEKATLIYSYFSAKTHVLEYRFESGQVITFNKAGGVFFDAQEKEETLIEIGNVYKALGQNQAALESYQQALAIVRNDELNRRQKEGKILERIGSVYDNLQYEDALKAYQQLLATVSSDYEKRPVLNSIGTVYRNMGRYQAALESYNQALAIVRNDKQRNPNNIDPNTLSDEGIILNNIGTVYEQLGQYSTALESYQKALAIVTESSWRQTTLINIGSVSAKMGQHQTALESYEQALALARGVNDRPTEGLTRLQLGKVYQKMGQHQTALESYQQALAICREVGNRAGEGQALNHVGEAYYHLEQYQTALEYYQQALIIREEVGDRTGKGVTLNNIASIFAAQSQPELAIIFYKQSVNITEAIRQDIRGLSKEQQQSFTETVAESYRRLADLLLQQNRVLEAQRVLDLLKVQELEDYLRNVRGSENSAQGVAERPQERQIREGMAAEIDQAIALGKELAQLEQIPPSDRTQAQKQRVVELRKTEQEITQQFNEFLSTPQVQTWIAQLKQTTGGQTVDLEAYATTLQDNLKKLQQDAVILYPFVLPDRLELVLITPHTPPLRRTVAVKREQLNQAIVELRSALTTPLEDAKLPAQKLYNWLIKPLENDLAQAQAKTLIYAPDGQLRYIPIAALYDGNQWLVERFRINHITAVSLTNLNTKPQRQLQVLAAAFTQGKYSFKVGNERYNFSGLPYAGREVESLAQTVPDTTQLLDEQFNQEIVLQMNDYSVVHLATHAAFVAGQPEESFILFGNGDRATLRDVKQWRLPNVDLVVLSACETGLGDQLGDGREILGFGYQMQQTGAKAAIASLWQVNDGGTQALMNAFYTALQGKNITKAEALRQAQVALITGDYTALGEQRGLGVEQRINSSLPSQVSDQLNHPYYWAPFILIGNGL